LLEDLLESGKEMVSEQRQSLSFSYMEIYNEQIFDLVPLPRYSSLPISAYTR
jgi:hypothetical protein